VFTVARYIIAFADPAAMIAAKRTRFHDRAAADRVCAKRVVGQIHVVLSGLEHEEVSGFEGVGKHQKSPIKNSRSF